MPDLQCADCFVGEDVEYEDVECVVADEDEEVAETVVASVEHSGGVVHHQESDDAC